LENPGGFQCRGAQRRGLQKPKPNFPHEVAIIKRNSNFFRRKSGFRLVHAFALDFAASSRERKLAFQNLKNFLYFSDFLWAADFFKSKMKRKFFGFGSPASFPKEPDAKSRGSGGRRKKTIKI
jgi:hypothetical protein